MDSKILGDGTEHHALPTEFREPSTRSCNVFFLSNNETLVL